MCVACDQLHATLKPSFLKLGTCVKAEFLGLLALPNSGFETGAFLNVNGFTRESLWFNPSIVFVSLGRQLSISCLGISVKEFMSLCDIVEKLRSRACELIEKSTSLWESI